MSELAPQRTLVFRVACDPRVSLPWLTQPAVLRSLAETLDRETKREVADALGRSRCLPETDAELRFARVGSVLQNRSACVSVKGDLLSVVAAADLIAEALPAQTAGAAALRLAERVSRIATRAGHGDAVDWIGRRALALWQRTPSCDAVAFAVAKQAPSTLDGACALRTLAGTRIEAYACHTDTVDELSTRPAGAFVVLQPNLLLVREAWRLDLVPTVPSGRPTSALARYTAPGRCACGRAMLARRAAFLARSEADAIMGFTEALDSGLCPLSLTALVDVSQLTESSVSFTSAFEADHPLELTA